MSDVIIGTLIGGGLALAGSAITIWITTKAETKRHMHRLGMELATVEWQRHMDDARLRSERSGKPEAIAPPMLYYYANARYVEAIAAKKIDDPKEMFRIIRESHKFVEDTVAKLQEADGQIASSGTADPGQQNR